MVTVYTKNNCPGCTATKRMLDAKEIDYTEKNVDTDEAARDKVIALGYMQMPVVVTSDDDWFGFRPDKIDTLF